MLPEIQKVDDLITLFWQDVRTIPVWTPVFKAARACNYDEFLRSCSQLFAASQTAQRHQPIDEIAFDEAEVAFAQFETPKKLFEV